MTEVRHDTCAEINTTQIGASTGRPAGRRSVRTEVGVHVAIIRLEETEREAMVQERQVVVHTAASRERGTPGPGLWYWYE